MNTTITFKVAQSFESTVEVKDAIEEGFNEFDRIVKSYTRFNQDSELSNLNRQGGNWVKVTEEFFELIEYMINLANKTNGVFDPTVIDYLEVYGYDSNYDFAKLENPDLNRLVEKIKNERASFREIEIDKDGKRVKLAKNQRIDLGGIGKGYAIDLAFNQLYKVTGNFLIDAGGDIRASGVNEKGEYWKVAMRNMKENKVLEDIGIVELKNQALASSGSWARRVKNFHHLINPRTGQPENKYSTVFVLGETGIEADSWATAIFVGGEEIIKNAPESLKVYTVLNENKNNLPEIKSKL